MSVFWFVNLLALVAASAPVATDIAPAGLTRVCYGVLHAPQADCDTSDKESAAPAPKRLGQGVAIVTPNFIAFDVVDDSSVNPARDVQRLRRVPFSASISDPERATSVSVTVRDAGAPAVAKWTITLSPEELAAANAIMVPEGRYEMAVSAPHYRSVTAAIDAHAEKPARASIVMRRIPTIAGRVVTWAGVPALDASVQPLPGQHPCATNTAGEFTCEAGGDWPAAIRIAYPGAGTKVIPVGPNVRDVRLGEITLQRAVTLKLSIGAPSNVRSVSATVLREGDGPPVEVATRSITFPASEPAVLTGFEAGDYRLVIRGEKPLQQFSKTIRIGESETNEKVIIHESQLTVNVTSGSKREPGASVTLKSIAGKWRGNLIVDEKGSATEPLWQPGEFSYALRAKGATTPLMGHGTLGDDESLQWTLELPAAQIEGKVLDDGGSAIADATVALTTDDGDMQTSIRTTSDANGHFAFEHVRKGSQTLTATADKYLPSEPVAFALSPTDMEHVTELRLKKGTSMRVSVVDRNGVPYPRAIVFEAVDNVLVNTLETGPSGDVEVKMPENGGPVVLIAVPASGSFGVRRIGAADREAHAVRINVADGRATLEIKSERADHVPVRDVHFLVRYDGEIIPYEVLMRLTQWRIFEFQTGAEGVGTIPNLPAGLYELWPYAKMTDVDMLTSGMDVPAPLRVALGEGLTSATMTFRKKGH
jgi:hypothetical protein